MNHRTLSALTLVVLACGPNQNTAKRANDAQDTASSTQNDSPPCQVDETLPGPDRVTTLLRVVWATHRTSGRFACEERDFVLRHLSL